MIAAAPDGAFASDGAGFAMRRMPWVVYLWPGLPQLWRRGLWSGLLLATVFAVLVDVMLLASLVWVELLNAFDLRVGWVALGLLWGVSTVVSARWGGSVPGPKVAAAVEELFRSAQREYLQGNWFEAEMQLARLLAANPRDVEGRLLRASLLRTTRRYDEALDELERMDLLQDGTRWQQEIDARTNTNCRSASRNVADRSLCGV